MIRDIIKVEKKEDLNFLGLQDIMGKVVVVIAEVQTGMEAPESRDGTMEMWKKCEAEILEAQGKVRPATPACPAFVPCLLSCAALLCLAGGHLQQTLVLTHKLRAPQGDLPHAICKTLRAIMDMVHKIRVDVINMKVKKITPTVLSNGVCYEKSKFAQQLAAGHFGTAGITQLLDREVEQQLGKQPPLWNLSQDASRAPMCAEIVKVALLRLIIEYPDWGGVGRPRGTYELPETMLIDSSLVMALNGHFHAAVVAAAITALVDQVMPPVREPTAPREVRFPDMSEPIQEDPNREGDPSKHQEIMNDVEKILKEKNPPLDPYKPEGTIRVVMDALSPHMTNAQREATQTRLEEGVVRGHEVYQEMVPHPPPCIPAPVVRYPRRWRVVTRTPG